MRRKTYYGVGLAGLIAGLVLAIHLKIIQVITHVNVYTLLLNIDYIPVLNSVQFSEPVEVSFHLIVSVVLSICLYYLMRIKNITTWKRVVLLSVVVNAFIAIMYFPLTALSESTPAITDLSTLLHWLGGHIVYGVLLGVLLCFLNKRE